MLRLAAILSVFLIGSGQTDLPGQRIVAASNVRFRATPQTDSEELERLRLGTLLTQLVGPSLEGWVHVRGIDGKTGWVLAALTLPYNTNQQTETYRQIVLNRIRIDTMSFNDAADLYDFVERILPDTPPSERAEFEFLHLESLAHVLRAISAAPYVRDPNQKLWLDKHAEEINYSEPAGEWFVRTDLYWSLESLNHGSEVGERIAWAGAKTGIPGECEGYMPCDLQLMLLTDAKYLELYPMGEHAGEALGRIDYVLGEMLKPDTPYTLPQEDHADFNDKASRILSIIRLSSAPQTAEVISRLERLQQTYR